ncbi:MAG: glycosyltransferase family 4 protein [Oscillospiraceae bacterium]
MKILWLTNIVLPQAAKLHGITGGSNGGWMVSQLEELSKKDFLQVTVVSPSEQVTAIETAQKGNITYITFPAKEEGQRIFQSILRKEKPDVVHIFGTEFKQCYDMLCVCDVDRAAVSIQGLVGEYSKYTQIGLPKNILRVSPIKNLIYRFFKVPSAALVKRDMENRGVYEAQALKKAKHILGRTQWDKACCLAINPQLTYHFCNELLRKEFYTQDQWQPENCRVHSIFVSQGDYAIKGLHIFLPVFAQILKEFPDSRLYVAGSEQKSHKNPIKQRIGDYVYDYGAYINRLIEQYSLKGHIEFLGSLTPTQMKEQFLSANVFLSCSTIENSPNSIGEAMLLGVPIVASEVGGVPSIFTGGEDGVLYPLIEPQKAKEGILEIFKNPHRAQEYGRRAKAHAMKTHNVEATTDGLIKIYSDLSKGDI